jgi:hypothetical protein
MCVGPRQAANLFHLAHNIGVHLDSLIEFSRGGSLPAETLQKLTFELFNGHAELDPETTLLRSVNREVRPLGNAPAPYNIEKHQPYHSEPVGPWTRSSLATPLPASPHPPPLKRPGWA